MTDAVAAAAAKHVVKKQTQSASEQCTGCCQSYPLKRSYFSAKFVPTPPNTIYSIQVSNGVKLVDWPIQEMHEFLGTQRQWGQYILRDDKLCRQIVAVFYTAYEKVIGARRGRASSRRAVGHPRTARARRAAGPLTSVTRAPSARCSRGQTRRWRTLPIRWTCYLTQASIGRSRSSPNATGSLRT